MPSLMNVPALILAGGLGTRLRTALSDRPKVLAPIDGQPFITRVLDQLIIAGIRDVTFCTGYLGDALPRTLGKDYGPLRLSYSQEPTPLGTAGAIALAARGIASRQMLVLNGDSYCAFDAESLLTCHIDNGAIATLLTVREENVSPYGSVEIDERGAVLAFREKNESAKPGLVNAGVYSLTHDILRDVQPGRAVSLEREIFPNWVGRGLHAMSCDGPLLDIGTPETYARAQAYFAKCRP
jgi:NDP-sugar pyrophosphorylase family protein